jgi:hypothetical protein
MQQLDEQLFKNVVDDTKIPIRIAFIKPDGSPNILSQNLMGLQIYFRCGMNKLMEKFTAQQRRLLKLFLI